MNTYTELIWAKYINKFNLNQLYKVEAGEFDKAIKLISSEKKLIGNMEREEIEYLNKINVFPVPDGDTGTNMAYTLTTIEEGIRDKAYKDIKRMSMAIADSALDGARGNSGAILAQFFVGFADGIKEKISLTSKEFAEAALHAKDYSYDALTHPREGTILSVIKAWAESLLESCNNSNDILSMLSNNALLSITLDLLTDISLPLNLDSILLLIKCLLFSGGTVITNVLKFILLSGFK